MKRLLAVGDSNSSNLYGKSWPDFLAEKLGSELLTASSPGAGNSFYIEKLHKGLVTFYPDVVVIQLTEPSRVVTGINFKTPIYSGYDSSNAFGDVSCYTWNCHDNDKFLENLTGDKVNSNSFWPQYIGSSKWVDYKVMQDVLTMYSLCKIFNTKVVFWNWFVDFSDLQVPSYKWLLDLIEYIPGTASSVLLGEKFNTVSSNDSHYGELPHNWLVDNWLYPNIIKKQIFI